MATKPYTVKKKIGGVEYTAQFNGISAALEAADSGYIDGTSTASVVKHTKYLLENVIVDPKGLTADDFDSMDDLNAVIGFARNVMEGNFRDKQEKQKSANTKGSE